ncbi:hypothetical protein [Geminicoccus roseus]|uniref:hypothetical protein n=1 Tax=Geminicoccus roseus TaxID=404900 RepID=UPI00041FAD37|nr:hypothetical protein [Geminicoccus roseus]
MSTVPRFLRLVPFLGLALLTACETPSGPGRPVDAGSSSIVFDHPLYQGAEGEYQQRSSVGGTNGRIDSATFEGVLGFVSIQSHRSAGDTYFSKRPMDDLVAQLGPEPEANRMNEEGVLPNSFPPVAWASFDMATGDGETLACVVIQRSGANATTARGGLTSALVVATECRLPLQELGEAEASALSNAVTIK